MNFLSKIGSDILLLLGAIAGAIALFFTFRSKYLNKGREEAINEIHGKNIEQLYQGLKDAQDNSEIINNSDADFIDGVLQRTNSEYDDHGRLILSDSKSNRDI